MNRSTAAFQVAARGLLWRNEINWGTQFKQWIVLMVAAGIFAQAAPGAEQKVAGWEQWQPLVGDWKGVGKGAPGEGAGGFSFAFDLQNKVLVRKAHTEYPAAEGRPAFAHDDLMIIHAGEASHPFRADYFDSEGHVIRYSAEFSPDGRTLTFVSDPIPSQPVFRLTYTRGEADTLSIRFEIAPPNAPDKFKVYVEGMARKG